MRSVHYLHTLLAALLAGSTTATQAPLAAFPPRTVSPALYADLEEHSRLVDITYCVGTGNTGITKPFTCLSRCGAFPSFELVTTWNTGPLLADSCGYIALSHAPAAARIVVAFRGTYSVANAVVDLATVRQEYVPYTGADGDGGPACADCAVHVGFFRSWVAAAEVVVPHLEALRAVYPGYELLLIGHSLGGAVAAIAALDFEARGWRPSVTTFGEPRVGNQGLARYVDARFGVGGECGAEEMGAEQRYRRVTHVDDPVPLLPLSEWGYVAHGGEVYIDKEATPPEVGDLQHCCGGEDTQCIAGQDSSIEGILRTSVEGIDVGVQAVEDMAGVDALDWGIPARYKLWQLLFAHRDYFWRLGLCVPELIREGTMG